MRLGSGLIPVIRTIYSKDHARTHCDTHLASALADAGPYRLDGCLALSSCAVMLADVRYNSWFARAPYAVVLADA